MQYFNNKLMILIIFLMHNLLIKSNVVWLNKQQKILIRNNIKQHILLNILEK